MTCCVCIMFLVPCLKEKHSLPNKLLEVIGRKESVLSSSSIDSGISVQRENSKERKDSWSLHTSSSSTPLSVIVQVDENSSLSDYESDEESCENHVTECEKDDMRNSLCENKLGFRRIDLQSICYGSQFEFHLIREDFLSADRETVV